MHCAGSRMRLLSLSPGADEREILMKRKQLMDARQVKLEIKNEIVRSERSDEREELQSINQKQQGAADIL